MRSALWNTFWIPDESTGIFPAKPGLHSLCQCRLTAWCWLGLQNQDFFLKWMPGTVSAAAFLNGLTLLHCCLGIKLNKPTQKWVFPGSDYTLSQNERLDEVGRDLWMSSGPAPWLRQGYLEPPAQDPVQTAFRHLQGWRYWQGWGSPSCWAEEILTWHSKSV